MPKPANSGGRHRGRYSHPRGPRKNERIRAREVRLLDPDGHQIGIMSARDAYARAKKLQLDLVEISATAHPPVCKICDYGKYMYTISKKEKGAKTKTTHKIKEIKLRIRIESHDYATKLRHAEEFLNQGNKLKISLLFRGRENEHKDLGFDLMKKAGDDLQHIGSIDSKPHFSGRSIIMTLSPLPENKRQLKLTTHKESEPPAEEEEKFNPINLPDEDAGQAVSGSQETTERPTA